MKRKLSVLNSPGTSWCLQQVIGIPGLVRLTVIYPCAGTEDMDTLTFQTPILLRHLTSPLSQKQPILEIHHSKILEGLDLSAEQFVDLCILCGCDYCGNIKGVGPKTALKGIRTHKCIENFLKHLDKKKHPPPADWLGENPIYKQVCTGGSLPSCNNVRMRTGT